MPRVERCPKHTRRKPRKTGKCIPYEPPYKTKYVRCPNGERCPYGVGRNEAGECLRCEKYVYKEPSYKRCKKGFRKDANGNCQPFIDKPVESDKSDEKKLLKKKLKEEVDKLKAMIGDDPKPTTESEEINTETFLKGINKIIKSKEKSKKTKKKSKVKVESVESVEKPKKTKKESKVKVESVDSVEKPKKTKKTKKESKVKVESDDSVEKPKKTKKTKKKSKVKVESVESLKKPKKESKTDSEELKIYKKANFEAMKEIYYDKSDEFINKKLEEKAIE